VYALPGGNPDRGETLTQTLKRELMEELGIQVQVNYMILCGDVIQPERKDDVLHVVFGSEMLSGNPTLNPAETTALAVVWQSIDALGSLTLYPNVGDYLYRWLGEDHEPWGYEGQINQPFF
jgi:8-oxo-dGTP diphosphatase